MPFVILMGVIGRMIGRRGLQWTANYLARWVCFHVGVRSGDSMGIRCGPWNLRPCRLPGAKAFRVANHIRLWLLPRFVHVLGRHAMAVSPHQADVATSAMSCASSSGLDKNGEWLVGMRRTEVARLAISSWTAGGMARSCSHTT
jgi:hypothetical protein